MTRKVIPASFFSSLVSSIYRYCTDFRKSIYYSLYGRASSTILVFGTDTHMHCIRLKRNQSLQLFLHPIVPDVTAIAAKKCFQLDFLVLIPGKTFGFLIERFQTARSCADGICLLTGKDRSYSSSSLRVLTGPRIPSQRPSTPSCITLNQMVPSVAKYSSWLLIA